MCEISDDEIDKSDFNVIYKSDYIVLNERQCSCRYRLSMLSTN